MADSLAPPPGQALPPLRSSVGDVRAIGMAVQKKRDREIIKERVAGGDRTAAALRKDLWEDGDAPTNGSLPPSGHVAERAPVAAMPGLRKPTAPAPAATTAPASGKRMTLKELAESRGVQLGADEKVVNEGGNAREVMENLEGGDGWSAAQVLKRPDLAANHQKFSGAGLAANMLGRMKPKQ